MADVRLLGCLISLVLVLTAFPAQADEGKEIFTKQCAGCHTIGGGDAGGPDLKGVGAARSEEWLVRVITEPDKLAADKDPDQLALVKKYGFEMPNLGVSRDDARKIVAFLKGGAPAKAPKGGGKEAAPPGVGPAAAPEAAPPAAPLQEAAAPTPAQIAQGKALFTGARRFAKGGAPCVACHTFTYPGVAAGNLAADLTYLYEGMGEQGIKGALKSLKFPIMKKAYDDRPLTDEEIAALVAFMRDAAGRKEPAPRSAFPAAGFGLFACIIVGLILYKRRIG